jgi:hypothetical protein
MTNIPSEISSSFSFTKYQASELDALAKPRSIGRVRVEERGVCNTCRPCQQFVVKVSLTPHTPCHVVSVVPALQKCKLIGLLSAEKVPLVIWMVGHEVLFTNVVMENEVCRLVISGNVDGTPVAVGQGTIFKRAEERTPDTPRCKR